MHLDICFLKRILSGLLTAFLLLNSLSFTAFAEEDAAVQSDQSEQTEQAVPLPDGPAQEEQPAVQPDAEAEQGAAAGENAVAGAAPEEEADSASEPGSGGELVTDAGETETDTETVPGTETEPETETDTEITEDGADSQLPPLPEDWSIYGEPEGYELLDIYERVYQGPPLTLGEAMRFIHGELSEALNRIADSVDHEDVYVRYNGGLEPTYRSCMAEVAAVFCALEGWSDPLTLKSEKLSTEQVELLRGIYWNMSSFSPSYRQDVSYSYSEDGSGELIETIVYHVQLDVDFLSASEYLSAADSVQQSIMDTVLSEPVRTELIKILSGEISDTDYGTGEIMAALPEDIDPMRRAVVESACSLVGKVSYFWGGIYDNPGWDIRWGVPKALIDDGTGELGDVYPFGLDCAGFVTWVLIDASGDPNAINTVGHGTMNQFSHSKHIELSQLQPGDLVFSYGNGVGYGHVGIIVGFNGDGEPLVCHSSSSGSGDVRIESLSATGLDIAATPQLFYDTY